MLKTLTSPLRCLTNFIQYFCSFIFLFKIHAYFTHQTLWLKVQCFVNFCWCKNAKNLSKNFHNLCYFMIADLYIYIYIYILHIFKILLPLFVDGVQLPQGYTKPLWEDSLLSTRNSWYSLDQSRKDERLRWPWIHPVVLNLYINLVITKYKFKSICQIGSLWPLTVISQSYLAGLSQNCQKHVSSAHM